MGKIDTSGWKEFQIGDLFEACLSKDDIQPKDFVEGKIPLVSSGKENNGIIAFVEDEKARLWDKNTLTIDMFGKVFYQESPYFAVSHGRVNILLPKISMTKWCLQFIGCAIEKVASQKYAFNEMCTGTKVLKDNIKLPATPDGAPDWAYMESYMANLGIKVVESLTLLQTAKDAEKKKVDTREWGEFRVGELFAQERGKEKAPKQNEPGDCPLIQETNNNNGFDRMVVPTKVIKGNSITVSINYAQNVFYQADDFCASVNIAVLRNNHLNRYNSQFVCSVLRNAHQKFDYTSKISKELLNKEMIMLPVDKTGQPDWVYMEEYMKMVQKKTENVLNQFVSV